MPTVYEFLKKVDLFASLPEEDLKQLCEMVIEIRLSQGEILFEEGDSPDSVYIIKEGELEVYKRSDNRQVQLATRSPGEMIGELSILEAAPRTASVRAATDVVLLAISQQIIERLLQTSPSAARTMLHITTSRLRSNELLLLQREKMAQVGQLTAGIAHELNNPSAAVRRGSDQLGSVLEQLMANQLELTRLDFTGEQLDQLADLLKTAHELPLGENNLDPLAFTDRSSELEDWLDERGVQDSWELAPILAQMGIDSSRAKSMFSSFPPEQLIKIVRWMGTIYDVRSLLQELGEGAKRISEIVKALKHYTYLDQAPVQLIDIHEGLDNTLVMMRHALKDKIHVRREYSADLPRIMAYGSELNQVWTNLISNSADALDGKGEIIIRTYPKDGCVIVEVEDNGPGIPEEIQGQIFNPFFTTKPVGKGNGLGLNISYKIIQKHNGEIRVHSKPGQTRFTIKLPFNFQEEKSTIMIPNPTPSDDILRNIYETTSTIAVVGISDKEDRPAFTVPAYLQSKGYRIIPVNPTIDSVLGERSYPDLLSLPETPDVVLVFRKSEDVPEVVTQAVQIGAKVVWMQEGIINQSAAAVARDAGLTVIMDTCMRTTHRRLFPSLQAQ